MAFNFNNNRSNNNNNNNNEYWRSDAFINIYLPTANGGRRKLGSIGLKKSRPAERQLIEFLSEDPDRIADVIASAEFDFRLTDEDNFNAFVLPTVATAANG